MCFAYVIHDIEHIDVKPSIRAISIRLSASAFNFSRFSWAWASENAIVCVALLRNWDANVSVCFLKSASWFRYFSHSFSKPRTKPSKRRSLTRSGTSISMYLIN